MVTMRFVPFCFLTLSVFPSAISAQSKSDSRSMIDYSSAVVSIHTLSIPDKAKKAYNSGVRLLNAKDWTQAAANCRRAIEFSPTFYEAYSVLGAAELGLQNWNDAEEAFRKSIELSGGNFAAPHFGLGLVLSHHEQFAEAEATIRAGLDLDPGDASGAFCLGWVLYMEGRLPEAEQSARDAVLHKPTFAEPYLLLAQIHRLERNPAAELDDLNAYLKLDPSSPQSARARAAIAEAQRTLGSESTLAAARP
jgi:tetratricopeptide (TPR) repeat protein